MTHKNILILKALLIANCLLIFLCINIYAESEPSGTIIIMVDMPDVKIYFNGELEGLAHPGKPLKREFVPIGSVMVTAKMEDVPSQSKAVKVVSNKISKLMFNMYTYPLYVKQLLEEGDLYFKQKAFLLPAEKNAFEIYKKVLRSDKKNAHAQNKLINMMQYFKDTGDSFYTQKQYSEAKTYYKNYVKIAGYAVKIFGTKPMETDLQAVKNLLENIQKLNRSPAQLLSDGDMYFQLERYLIPKNENAFEMYKAALALEPDNKHARKKLYEMIQIYETLGAEAEEKNYIKAKIIYENYLSIIKYCLKSFQDNDLKDKYKIIKDKIKSLKRDIAYSKKLAKRGDSYFIAEKFTTPENKNAFKFYKDALEADPTNKNAKKRILEVMKIYKNWGKKELNSGDLKQAEKFYNQYIFVAQYFCQKFDSPRINRELTKIKQVIEDMKSINKLLIQGDIYFQKQQFVMPEKKNALNMYKKVLDIESNNSHALKRIQEMLEICYKGGEDAFLQSDYKKSKEFFTKYLSIWDYILKKVKNSNMNQTSQKVKDRLKEIENKSRFKRLTKLRLELKKNFQIYQNFKDMQDQSTSGEMLSVMKKIVENLKNLEQLYSEFPNKDSKIMEKLKRVKNTRWHIEDEIANIDATNSF